MDDFSFRQVSQALERIGSRIHRTPVVTSRTFDALTGTRVFFKCENLQRGGAFKVRGALNRLTQLTPEERTRGVVSFSSGNHAQGMAIASRELGVPVVIVMPNDAPRAKAEATAGYGAEIVWYDRQTQDREAVARRLAEERGLTVVPPYDDHRVMAGQGTAALELWEDADGIDVLVGPVGGGGLMSGCSVAVHARNPNARVFGVEAETANDTHLSLRAGKRVSIPPSDTIADGMRGTIPGELTFPVLQSHLTDIVLVSDDEIREAMRFVLFRMKMLIEPTGAVGVAALLFGKIPAKDAKVGVILSGGNVDADMLASVLALGI